MLIYNTVIFINEIITIGNLKYWLFFSITTLFSQSPLNSIIFRLTNISLIIS